MARALLLVTDELSSISLCGRSLPSLLAETCAAAGMSAEVVAPSAGAGAGRVLVVDGRFPTVTAATLAGLAAAGASGRALGPDGQVIAAFVREAGDRTAAAILAGESPAPVRVGPDEAWDAADGLERALAEKVLQRRIVAAWARGGVRFVDPERVVVEAAVQLAPGCTIWPDVVLRGRTALAAGAEVQSGCWLVDTTVGEGSVVRPHSVCEGARVGARCAVGPMAHLREGAHLDEDVRVGNFVEVKKSRLRRGTKAQHLTYLGDADIGEETNVGAGTITCNFDGFAKHPTTVGRGAFIGSNTALVAPVTIGDGAIIGAGSVITADVPAEALAVERTPQRTFAGKAPGVRERNRLRARGSER